MRGSREYLAVTKPALKKLHSAMIKHDFDYVLLIVGYERTGKSTLALHIAKEFDPDFDVRKQVCYDTKSLFKAVYTCKPGQCIIADEGAVLAMSREAMTSDNREFVRLLTVMGAQNLMLIICLPAYHMLDKYAREHRVSSVIKVTSRGRFKFYNASAKKRIYFNPKHKAWVWPDPTYKDSFGKLTGKMWSEYKKAKQDYLSGRKKEWLDVDDPERLVKIGTALELTKLPRQTLKDKGKRGEIHYEIKNKVWHFKLGDLTALNS